MQFNRPTLLLDRAKCMSNIGFMAEKASRHKVFFRPHFKTHQSAEIGQWFRDFGVSCITVSSVTMAKYFAVHGWDDITIAIPANLAEMTDINLLAGKINLNLLVESNEVVEFLAANLHHQAGIFVKVDAGYHRTGIDVEQHDTILGISHLISTKRLLNFKGLVVHNGHTYHPSPAATGQQKEAIKTIHDQSLARLNRLKSFLQANGVEPLLSVGDTPAMTLTENFEGIGEIRPGNFVFYDLMQQKLGVCGYDQIAVAMACPVVATHPGRLEVVIYGGAVHLSKESVEDENGNKIFGEVVWLNEKGWSAPLEQTFVRSLSQEHGIIKTTPEFFHQFRPGMFVGILPVHSCLTNSLMPWIKTLNGQIIQTMNLFPGP